MKNLYFLLLIPLTLFSCKKDNSSTSNKKETLSITITINPGFEGNLEIIDNNSKEILATFNNVPTGQTSLYSCEVTSGETAAAQFSITTINKNSPGAFVAIIEFDINSVAKHFPDLNIGQSPTTFYGIIGTMP